MPYEKTWIDAEEFFEYKGVTIYKTYDYDDVESGENPNWYGFKSDCSKECGAYIFYIFNLARMVGLPKFNFVYSEQGIEDIKDLMRLAIDSGVLTQNGVRGVDWK